MTFTVKREVVASKPYRGTNRRGVREASALPERAIWGRGPKGPLTSNIDVDEAAISPEPSIELLSLF